MRVDPQQLEKAIFLGKGVERFMQDSPILPDVWAEYGQRPNERVDLLVNAYKDEAPGRLCDVLLARLKDREKHPTLYRRATPLVTSESREAAVNQSTVVIRLYFDELVCVVLPMTRWWNENIWKDKDKEKELQLFLDNKKGEQGDVIRFMERYPLERKGSSATHDDSQYRQSSQPHWFSSQLLWLVRVVGAIALAGRDSPAGVQSSANDTFRIDGNEKVVVEAAVELLRDFRTVKPDDVAQVGNEPTGPRPRSGKGMDADARSFIWSVNLNRMAKTAMNVSTTTVKADAARLLFDISCKHLTWAIIDSGVDARHPALQRRPESAAASTEASKGEVTAPNADNGEWRQPAWTETTRVTATYDFTIIRKLLNREEDEIWQAQLPEKLRRYFRNEARREEFRNRLRQGRSIDWDYLLGFLAIPYRVEPPAPPVIAPTPQEASGGGESPDDGGADAPLGQPSDVPSVEIPNAAEADGKIDGGDDDMPIPYYIPPLYNHGTHVAGILAADWQEGDEGNSLGYALKGVCPDIKIFDLRVLGHDGAGDEFSLIAAMQFVRHLNSHTESMAIHGVNLSISIKHNVKNYACGCTPVCEESERLVNAGLVVVAAAGNDGYLHYLTRGNKDLEGYSSISITDPGNSEAVITVGSTHREKAHAYGISFFSSRGPTGDGRAKPDLVAPGEKIVSLVPGGNHDTMDGTSMAAPHVSGAAALLLARYPELIGRPTRVKEILCATATDLGRERYFQGRGMLDILRAMQSI
jgi:serine protease AprX